MGFHHRPPRCGPKQIVYPTKCNTVHHCTQSEVQHIHPSHTTVMNHHLVKNTHLYPHSTSYENTVNSVDVYGGSYQVPNNPGMVGGAMNPGMVGGAMNPGTGNGYGGKGGGAKKCGHHWGNNWCR
ncbi:spore coat protein [Cerasibacillus terrae]|uniref:Spore coat protein n=1 Tax=Cerasibacillus terrae TaxID=2498845 RepID=A0A5C8NTF8_9BACI|nr:CotD family spore coat protein [Cerasibacillus terrae]TXL64528.1 spore coat protein [Cerasibacillus terrae]